MYKYPSVVVEFVTSSINACLIATYEPDPIVVEASVFTLRTVADPI